MKKLLVLGASEFQIPLLRQATAMGIHTCVLDINPNAYGVQYANEYRECSLKDQERALSIARDYLPDGVTVGMCDVAVNTCAYICEQMGLPGLPVDVARRATNKYFMIDAFRENQVPSPAYIYFTKSQYDKSKIPLHYPIISKPVDMAGSRGINLITSEAELDAAIQNSIDSSDQGDVILEEYMVGPEVSVEIFIEQERPNVLQITDKITSGPPHFIEVGHIQPSGLSDSMKERVSQVACAAVRALGLRNCVAHAEIIITEDGPKMVEVGARMGGDGIQQQLIELSTGINLQEAVIRLALGENVKCPTATLNCGSAIKFIPAKCGTIQSIEFKAIENSRVYMKRLFCKVGDYFEEAHDNSSRYGYVIARADNPGEAIDACEDIISQIEINVI